jgi:hypothetical protein
MRVAVVITLSAFWFSAPASTATAQTAALACAPAECAARKWNELHEFAIQQLKENDKDRRPAPYPELKADVEAREAATRQASVAAAVDPLEPDDSAGAATVRRLAGAIKTNPEGTEAGLSIAPFALAGSEMLAGLEFSVAALKDDLTRAGVTYTFDGSPTLAEVWRDPQTCPLQPRIDALEKPKSFFLAACSTVVAELPYATLSLSADESREYGRTLRRAQIACGLVTPRAGETRVDRLPDALAQIRKAVELANTLAQEAHVELSPPVVVRALGLSASASEFRDWGPALWTECYSDKDIRGHLVRLYWNHRTWKLAVGASFDLFPRKYGFSPDGSELPKGDTKSGEVRLGFSTVKAGTEVGVSTGFGRSRDKLVDELRSYIPVSFSVAKAFSLLKRRPLTTYSDRERESVPALNVVDGGLPPRLVLGFSAAVQLALDKRESQETSFNAVRIQPHIDFLINSTLSFRLGIPLRGEIAVRDKKEAVAETPTSPATPAVAEKRALQWTVPVALVAVLKL